MQNRLSGSLFTKRIENEKAKFNKLLVERELK